MRKPAMLDSSLGSKIRVRRKSMGLTQAKLAVALGVSFQQVQKYERGISAISPKRLQQICDIMNLPPDFFGDVGDTFIGKVSPANPESVSQDPQPDGLERFLASGEGKRLVESFTSIADQRLRTRILDFIASIAIDQTK